MTEAELLANIVESPADDAPREVYADWLTERGDPRGEMIVLQLQRERGGGHADKSERERDLFDAHGDAWLGALAELDDADAKKWTFGWRRGFVDGAYYEGDAPRSGLDALSASAPALRRLYLEMPSRVLSATLSLVAGARLRGLVELHLTSHTHVEHVVERVIDLSGLPRLALISANRVGELRLAHPTVRELRCDGHAVITGNLPAVERLVLRPTGIANYAMDRYGVWPNLTSMHLHGPDLAAGLPAWIGLHPRLVRLEVDRISDAVRDRLPTRIEVSVVR